MLGNVTKFVWNAVDPRPVYKKAAAAAKTAVKYESFDTSGVTGSLLSSLDLSGASSSLVSSSAPTRALFSSSAPTFTPIPDFSGQSMYNIVFSCYNITSNPPPTNLTPDQLQQRQANVALCNANNAYFCKYIQDSSANFAAGDYTALTKTFCKPGVGALVGSIAGGVGAGAIVAYIALAIGALLCASLAANQMMYMPAIMRIMVFLIVLSVSFINPFVMAAILLYFVFILSLDLFRHSKNIYNMDQFIFPATLLPLRLRRPDDSFLFKILFAPFTYLEPNPADEGRKDYLAGIDQYVTNLQRGAKLTDEIVKTANLEGLKETIAKGFRDPVEAIVRVAENKATAAPSALPATGPNVKVSTLTTNIPNKTVPAPPVVATAPPANNNPT